MGTDSKRLMESVAVAIARAAAAGQTVSPYRVCGLAIELDRVSRRLRSFAEEDCERGLSPARALRRDALEQREIDIVGRIADALGAPHGTRIDVETQRDPRGAAIAFAAHGAGSKRALTVVR